MKLPDTVLTWSDWHLPYFAWFSFSMYVEPCGQHFCEETMVPGVLGAGLGLGGGKYSGEVGGDGGDGGGGTGGGGDGEKAHVSDQPTAV